MILLIFPATALGEPGVFRAPGAIPGLPEEIRSALEQQRCKIPLGVSGHVNVIRGSFAKQGQIDWAVLCSVAGESHIQVFWGGSARCPSRLAARPDRDYLSRTPEGSDEYYRGLGTVGKTFILKHHQAYSGPKPPRIMHDGIDDRFIEKASVVHYCHEGKWLALTGAD